MARKRTHGGRCKFWSKKKKVPKGWRLKKSLRKVRLICRIK